VKQVQSQVFTGNQKGGVRGQEERKFNEKKDAKKKDEANALLASLFKNAQGLSKAGTEEAVKDKNIDLYSDPRDGTENMPQDTIITCKHFLDAVEDEKYGWRWECPNKGAKCQYRHMLPQGYVVTSKKEREAMKKDALKRGQDENQKTIEEAIEEERAALKFDDLTPVTKESFFAWKARRAERKQKELEDAVKAAAESKAKARQMAKGKNSIMNGRALFTYNPDLFQDDANAGGADTYEEQKE